jgi:alpha-D-glucose phosphate-specific phosphoglucomutase
MIKFGTDGWRAIIAEDFTFQNVKVVSQAIADYLNREEKKRKRKKVVVGYDCRFLSKEFATTVSLILAANDIGVTLSDRVVPTPAVSLHSLIDGYDLGIMITASHNPSCFNGLKIKTKDGGAADSSLTNKVEKFLYKSKPRYIDLETAKKKKFLKFKCLIDNYIEFLRKFVDIKRIKKLKLKILVDTMYGATDKLVEKILGKSEIKIDYLHNEFNPSFGGVNPEPVEKNLQELIKKIKKEKYDLGVALDGDGDRISLIDSKGNFINAQIILPLLAIHLIKNRKEEGGIGKTVVGSNLIDEVASSLGIPFYETPVGFKHISNLFKENLICIGGEEAGGIGFKGYIPERDGTCSFLLLLEMIAYENRSFDNLLKEIHKRYGKWYYQRIALPLNKVKKELDDLKLPSSLCGKKIERINTLDGIKLITKDSWLMFRKSGTEPIVRIYAESKSRKETEELLSLGEKIINAL